MSSNYSDESDHIEATDGAKVRPIPKTTTWAPRLVDTFSSTQPFKIITIGGDLHSNQPNCEQFSTIGDALDRFTIIVYNFLSKAASGGDQTFLYFNMEKRIKFLEEIMHMHTDKHYNFTLDHMENYFQFTVTDNRRSPYYVKTVILV